MPEISRRQFAVYLVAVVLVVLLGGRALRADTGTGAVPAGGFTAGAGSGSADGAGAAPGRSGPSGASGAGGVEVGEAQERLLVHVAGDVRRPGVYELAAGDRVADALKLAGGGRSGAELDALNLAAKLTDGQQVLVARRGRGGAAAAAGTGGATATAAGAGAVAGTAPGSAPATVDVNQADATQLEALNGVGPAIAAKIVAWRTQNGPFRSVEDLAQVPGIGPKKLEAMRAQVVT